MGRGNHFLGYSVEKGCSKTPLIPHKDRPRQVYVLAKLLSYFYHPAYVLFEAGGQQKKPKDLDFYTRSSREHNITFFGQMSRRGATDDMVWPKGIAQFPSLSKSDFHRFIASSLVTLGVGQPLISPSPYESLCLGVPFINPIATWDKKDPMNRDKWQGQADGLIVYGIDEPYVYHVHQGDIQALNRALVKAINTPIEK